MANFVTVNENGTKRFQRGGIAPPNSTELDDATFAAATAAAVIIPVTVSSLTTYANNKLSAYWFGYISVNVGTTDVPIIVMADVTAKGQSDVLGLLAAFANGSTTEPWYQTTGKLQLNAAQMSIISLALKKYVLDAMMVWQNIIDGINATPPTITSNEQINAVVWPTRATV